MAIQSISNATMNGSTSSVQAVSRTPAASNQGGTASNANKSLASSSNTGSTSTNTLYYDVRDTNHDGVVSLAEQIAYELTHAGAAISNQAEGSNNKIQLDKLYNQQGNVQASAQGIPNLINITA
jgi:hypothetical protein